MTFVAVVLAIALVVSLFLLTCSLVAAHDRITALERQVPPKPARPDLPRRGITR